jgi:hypothetical protein
MKVAALALLAVLAIGYLAEAQESITGSLGARSDFRDIKPTPRTGFHFCLARG